MLVLSRFVKESVNIEAFDKDGKPVTIVVTIVERVGDKIRIGFEAPKNIVINRKEVSDKIKASDTLSASST